MSSNLLLENDTDPIVWRGPVIANMVTQFWTDVMWGELDYLFVDMPPGTGDVPLTVFQSIGVDGIVIVTSPQELVSMIVEKAVNMANLMDIEVLGIVENYSYIECPDCKKKINVFGESKVDEVAKKYNLEVLGKLPIDPTFANLCDKGQLEDIKIDYLDKANEKYTKVFCEQAINYWLLNIDIKKFSSLFEKDGLFIFNTFSNKPSNKPMIKEYVLDDKSYLEISYLVDNKVHHIQVCEGYEPHFTVFDWISKEQYKELLSPYFDIDIKDDGKSSLYICKRR